MSGKLQPSDPFRGPANHRSPQIATAVWDRHRDEITSIYTTKVLEEVIEHMWSKYGFKASRSQYVYHLKNWGVYKYSVTPRSLLVNGKGASASTVVPSDELISAYSAKGMRKRPGAFIDQGPSKVAKKPHQTDDRSMVPSTIPSRPKTDMRAWAVPSIQDRFDAVNISNIPLYTAEQGPNASSEPEKALAVRTGAPKAAAEAIVDELDPFLTKRQETPATSSIDASRAVVVTTEASMERSEPLGMPLDESFRPSSASNLLSQLERADFNTVDAIKVTTEVIIEYSERLCHEIDATNRLPPTSMMQPKPQPLSGDFERSVQRFSEAEIRALKSAADFLFSVGLYTLSFNLLVDYLKWTMLDGLGTSSKWRWPADIVRDFILLMLCVRTPLQAGLARSLLAGTFNNPRMPASLLYHEVFNMLLAYISGIGKDLVSADTCMQDMMAVWRSEGSGWSGMHEMPQSRSCLDYVDILYHIIDERERLIRAEAHSPLGSTIIGFFRRSMGPTNKWYASMRQETGLQCVRTCLRWCEVIVREAGGTGPLPDWQGENEHFGPIGASLFGWFWPRFINREEPYLLDYWSLCLGQTDLPASELLATVSSLIVKVSSSDVLSSINHLQDLATAEFAQIVSTEIWARNPLANRDLPRALPRYMTPELFTRRARSLIEDNLGVCVPGVNQLGDFVTTPTVDQTQRAPSPTLAPSLKSTTSSSYASFRRLRRRIRQGQSYDPSIASDATSMYSLRSLEISYSIAALSDAFRSSLSISDGRSNKEALDSMNGRPRTERPKDKGPKPTEYGQPTYIHGGGDG